MREDIEREHFIWGCVSLGIVAVMLMVVVYVHGLA